MLYKSVYSSPIGKILLAAEDGTLCGLWFEGQKYYPANAQNMLYNASPVLTATAEWLDAYFAGSRPSVKSLKLMPPETEFRRRVTEIMLSIPYGQTVSYGEIAREVSPGSAVASRAVGTAVGHNRISIIVPCHRVIGSDGKLHGYAGGLERKIFLLSHEGADIRK